MFTKFTRKQVPTNCEHPKTFFLEKCEFLLWSWLSHTWGEESFYDLRGIAPRKRESYQAESHSRYRSFCQYTHGVRKYMSTVNKSKIIPLTFISRKNPQKCPCVPPPVPVLTKPASFVDRPKKKLDGYLIMITLSNKSFRNRITIGLVAHWQSWNWLPWQHEVSQIWMRSPEGNVCYSRVNRAVIVLRF